MGDVVMIGDALHGAAFRLAGLDVREPSSGAPEALVAEFERARDSAALIVLSRRVAEALPDATLRQALAREAPLVVVLPELTAPAADEALVRRMHAVLGIEA